MIRIHFTALFLLCFLVSNQGFSQSIKDSLTTQITDTLTTNTVSESSKINSNLAIKALPETPKVIPQKDAIAATKMVEKTIPAHSIKAIGSNLLKDLFYELALNFRLSRGNQNYTNLMPQANIGFESQLVGLKTNVLYNYAELNGTTLNGDLWAKNAVTLLPKSTLPIQWLAGGESSKIRQLPSRYQTGLGINLKLIDQKTNDLNLGLNGVYDRTRYEGVTFVNDAVETTNTRTIYGPLVQLSGRHELSEGRILLTYDVSALLAVNKRNDYRFNTIGALVFPVIKGIDLRATMIYSYESVILQGTKPSDLFITFGLGYGKF